MVSTVKPNARDEHSSPKHTPATAAASAALQHPPRTSQKVPTNSAAIRLDIAMVSSLFCRANSTFLVDFDRQLADGAAPGVELLLHDRAHFFGRRAGSLKGLAVELGAHLGSAQDKVGLARQALDDFLRRPGGRDERYPGIDGKWRQARFDHGRDFG